MLGGRISVKLVNKNWGEENFVTAFAFDLYKASLQSLQKYMKL